MESEAEPEASSTPTLPIMLSILPMQSPEPSGMLTPPLQTSASVPFRWEEEPGKPRPCTILTLCNNDNNGPKCLELPPCRLLLGESKFTKTPSPTTVLDGTIFQSSSFRFRRERRQGSFGSSTSLSPERGQLGPMVLAKKGHKETGFFGSWGQRTLKSNKGCSKKDVDGGSSVFSSSMDIVGCGGDDSSTTSTSTGVKKGRIRRNGSFTTLSQTRSHFWAAMYKGFKNVIPWSRKSKKEGLII
uniref:Uncharacterized protein n=1 Tax=Davidia involucrata TaxID=16924 RepID=A0A5B6YK69_DAVIN